MTLTVESCTPAVQPSQTRTTSKNEVRTMRWARRKRASLAWKMKIKVRADSSSARSTMFSLESLQASTQAGTVGGKSEAGSTADCGCSSGCGAFTWAAATLTSGADAAGVPGPLTKLS